MGGPVEPLPYRAVFAGHWGSLGPCSLPSVDPVLTVRVQGIQPHGEIEIADDTDNDSGSWAEGC